MHHLAASLVRLFDDAFGSHALRGRLVLRALIEGVVAAVVHTAVDAGVFSGQWADPWCAMATRPFLAAVGRSALLLVPLFLLGHVALRLWRAAHRRAGPAVVYVRPAPNDAPEDVPSEIGLVTRPDGTVLVLVVEATDDEDAVVGPGGTYIRLLPGDTYAGLSFETWAEQIGRVGAVAELGAALPAIEAERGLGDAALQDG